VTAVVASGARARLPVDRIVETLRHELRGVPSDTSPLALEPFVLPPPLYEELFCSARRLLALCHRAVLACGDDRDARAAALGATDEDYPPELYLDDVRLEDELAACMARPDVVVTAGGPRFVEFNVGGAVGGVVQTHLLLSAWTRAYGGASAPFRSYDPFPVRARLVARIAHERRLARTFLLVGSLRDFDASVTSRYLDAEPAFLRHQGFDAAYAEPEDLPAAIGSGRPRYELGLRHFNLLEWREHGIDYSPVADALAAGCLLLAPQTATFLANKKILAWLSEGRPWMSRADRRYVAHYVPWTRIVADTAVEWDGRRTDLLDLLVRERERFVLKPAIGVRGVGVLIGRDVPDADWTHAVEAAAHEGSTVAQAYVEPVRLPLKIADTDAGTALVEEVRPVFAPFVFGGEAAGCLVRYRRDGDSAGPINTAFGALRNIAVAADGRRPSWR
jgi:hypothetical protein